MRHDDTDALLVSCPRDLLWLLGLRTAGNPPVHCAVVSATSAHIVVITRRLEMSNVTLRNPHHPDIVASSYTEDDDPVQMLVSALQPFQTVTIDGSCVSANVFRALEACLNTTRLRVLRHSQIASLRLIKDECELQAMRRAASAAAQAVEKVAQCLRSGMTETEVAQMGAQTICASGAEVATYPPFVHSGRIRCQLGHCAAESGARVPRNQLTFVEFGASVGQYHGARMHTIFTGPRAAVPETVLCAERAVSEALLLMQLTASANRTVHDVANAGMTQLAHLVPQGWQISSRMGYSIGICQGEVDWGEANVLCVTPGGTQVLQEGMTMHLIPYVTHTEHGAVAFSRCVLVTAAKQGAVDLAEMHHKQGDLPKMHHKPAITCLEEPGSVRLDRGLGALIRQQLAASGLVTAPTPLRECPPEVLRRCGVSRLLIKNEALRGSTQQDSSFKMLGGGYAVLQAVATELGCEVEWQRVRQLGTTIHKHRLTLYTATDGNHGAAVAWAARQLGQRAVVFMPAGSEPARVDRVRQLGAEVIVTDCSYDQTVRMAAKECAGSGVLVQDTEPPRCGDSEEKALWACKAGYTCMCLEVLEQLEVQPTHVFVQVGVGSLAAAVFECLSDAWGDQTRFVAIEPVEAACLHRSLAKGQPVTVPDHLPVFSAGLACHTVSRSAWQVLRRVCDASVTCASEHTMKAINLLAAFDVCSSGDSGAAVPVGALSHMSPADREKIGITSSSVVLCFNTEGQTVPQTSLQCAVSGGEIQVQTNPNRARL